MISCYRCHWFNINDVAVVVKHDQYIGVIYCAFGEESSGLVCEDLNGDQVIYGVKAVFFSTGLNRRGVDAKGSRINFR